MTYVNPALLAGDVNIRLERVTDPDAVEFNSLLAGYGLSQLVDGATHEAGRMLDVVCCGNDLNSSSVDIIDVGLSDHCLLRWTSSLKRPAPVYTKSTHSSFVAVFPLSISTCSSPTSDCCRSVTHSGGAGSTAMIL